MSRHMKRALNRLSLATLVVALAIIIPPVGAQVPEGWYATSHLRYCGDGGSDRGRVLVINPETRQLFEVEGLPDDLRSIPCSGTVQGAASILLRPEDGALIVGEATAAGRMLEIYILELDGFAVDHTERFPVGAAAGGESQVSQMAFLGDGRILFSCFGLGEGQGLGVLDPDEPDQPVQLFRIPAGQASALTVDLEEDVAYFADVHSRANSTISAVSLSELLDSNEAEAWSVASVPMGIQDLSISPKGGLLAVGFGARSAMFAIDPEGGEVERLCTDVPDTLADSMAMTVDPRREEIVVYFGGPTNNRGLAGNVVSVTLEDNGCSVERRALSFRVNNGILSGIAVSSVPDLPQPFVVEPDDGEPLGIQVDASAVAKLEGLTIASYEWDFGDGATAQGAIVNHTYTAPGRYLITLMVTNDQGRRAAGERDVLVFPFPSGDVAPWSSEDIGGPAFPGRARFEGEGEERAVSLCAGGRVLSGREDSFHFVYQEYSGNTLLTARVTSREGGASQVGVMLRESLDPDASYVAMTLSRTDRFRFSYRNTKGGSTRRQTEPGSIELPNAWVRIERQGEELIGSVSTDGGAWEEVHRMTIAGFPEVYYGGVFAAGGQPGDDGSFEATQAQFRVEAPPPPSGRFIRGDCNHDGKVNISDATCALDRLFAGAGAPACLAALNANGDENVDIADAVSLLNFLFGGGEAPVPPFPDCGPGTLTADAELGCANPPDCR